MKNYKNLSKFFILNFLFLILLASCGDGIEEIKPFQISDDLPTLSARNMETSYKSESRLQATVLAPLANQYQNDNPYMEFPEGLKIYFFDENMDTTSNLTANYAIYYEKQKLWKASGDVVVLGKNGSTMKTEEIYGNEKEEKIYSIKYVEVTDPDGSVIRGKSGFEANFEFTNYKFKNVDGVIEGLNEEIEK